MFACTFRFRGSAKGVETKLELRELKELIQALHQSDVAELCLEDATKGTKLTLRKAVAVAAMGSPAGQAAERGVGAAQPAAVEASAVSAAAAPEPKRTETDGASDLEAFSDDRYVIITAPMVGVFYRAPAPDAEPYVKVGDLVEPGQPLCIIEAMKLMNEIESEVRGRIVKIFVENAEPVEYGQPLFAVEKE